MNQMTPLKGVVTSVLQVARDMMQLRVEVPVADFCWHVVGSPPVTVCMGHTDRPDLVDTVGIVSGGKTVAEERITTSVVGDDSNGVISQDSASLFDGIIKHHTMQVMNTREAHTRQQLQALGWMTPEDVRQLQEVATELRTKIQNQKNQIEGLTNKRRAREQAALRQAHDNYETLRRQATNTTDGFARQLETERVAARRYGYMHGYQHAQEDARRSIELTNASAALSKFAATRRDFGGPSQPPDGVTTFDLKNATLTMRMEHPQRPDWMK